jgi:hypothetical protein
MCLDIKILPIALIDGDVHLITKTPTPQRVAALRLRKPKLITSPRD